MSQENLTKVSNKKVTCDGREYTILLQEVIVDRDINGEIGIYLKHVAFAINQPVPVV